ncbi:hypothetical protein NC652_007996 [Populus alba x Populus x berolinensis]|nr:hypothetical protein NC652_007996 [Populus alba x Populus x berolinensis]
MSSRMQGEKWRCFNPARLECSRLLIPVPVAGIQADLKACFFFLGPAREVYCSTVDNFRYCTKTPLEFRLVHAVPEDFVAQQLIGLLPSVGVVKVLLQSLTEFSVPMRGAPSHGQHSDPKYKRGICSTWWVYALAEEINVASIALMIMSYVPVMGDS